jgi:GxxExxY protein
VWHTDNEPDAETEQLAHQVIGACIEVHRHLGPGFPESAYEAALCIELGLRGIAVERQLGVSIQYKGVEVGSGRLDILVARCLILELKAVEELGAIHTAQMVTYLKATWLRLGFVVNFNATRMREGIKRVVYTR